MRFAQPAESWAMLFGSASYTDSDLPGLPAVANNLHDFRGVLTDPDLGGLRPEHCVVMADPSSLPTLGMELAHVARRAEDTLIVYYAGHGLLDESGALFLALPETNPEHVVYTGLPLTWVRRAIADSPARNRILILDCCFSGRAIEAMASPSALISGQIEIAGVYTLTSAPANEPARAPLGARHTAFTGELLNVLRNGIDNVSEGLSLEEIYLQLRRTHLVRGLPPPQQHSTSTAGHLALVRNVAFHLNTRPGLPATGVSPVSPPSAPATIVPGVPVASSTTMYDPAAAQPWAAGLAAWRAGNLDDADRLIRDVIESAADNRTLTAASIALGLLYRDGYHDLEAAEALLASTASGGDARLAALGRLHLGCALELKGNMPAAETEYRAVMDTAEVDCAAFAAARLGWILTDRGLATEAERIFRGGHALGDSPVRVWPTLGLADTLMRSGRSDEAADRYEELLTSEDAHAKAFAALGIRQFFMESGLMTEAAEFAHSIVESPAATSLWPAVLADEAPITPEGRMYAMSKWLTWLRSADGEAVCFADKANPQQFVLFEDQDVLTMSVCVMPRALPRRLRGWYAKEISPQLAEMGFKQRGQEENLVTGGIDTWVMNVEDSTDHELAGLTENILTESLSGRSDFRLDVEPKPDVVTNLQPRAPIPELMPH
jgi:tetratricopeptide (TPR) repeat protein